MLLCCLQGHKTRLDLGQHWLCSVVRHGVHVGTGPSASISPRSAHGPFPRPPDLPPPPAPEGVTTLRDLAGRDAYGEDRKTVEREVFSNPRNQSPDHRQQWFLKSTSDQNLLETGTKRQVPVWVSD